MNSRRTHCQASDTLKLSCLQVLGERSITRPPRILSSSSVHTDVGAPIDDPDDVLQCYCGLTAARSGAAGRRWRLGLGRGARAASCSGGWIDFSDGRMAKKKEMKARPDKYGAGSEEWTEWWWCVYIT